MRLLLNVIWLIFGGFWLFLGYVLAGVLLCIPIITIPWAIASFRIATFALWPFGRTIVAKPSAGVGSFLGNVIWFVLAGWWLASSSAAASARRARARWPRRAGRCARRARCWPRARRRR